MKKITAALLALTSILMSCDKENKTLEGTHTGPEVPMGNGKAFSWIKTDKEGKPVSIGFTLTTTALDGLPDHADEHAHNSTELVLPKRSSNTVFDHIVIDWNPEGHPPAPIYAAPHFDFHMYMMTSSERKAIPAYESDSSGFLQFPGADYLPSGYFNPGGGAPQMGAHWIDPTSPELNGQPFTETFIYGSYKGSVNFLEPMVSYEFLKSTDEFSRTIPRPAKVKTSGYYPTIFRIKKTANGWDCIFEGMEWRAGS